MFVELHIIQSFAPSNLNRDDTNSPKDCVFGGVRRARVSSQCFKRAIRTHDVFSQSVAGSTGVRTRYLAAEVVRRLAESGRDQALASSLVSEVLAATGYGQKDGKTSVLLYLSPGEIDSYAEAIEAEWDQLVGQISAEPEAPPAGKAGAKGKKAKKSTVELSKEFAKKLQGLGSQSDAADIALFGRMVAENKNLSIDASCQVAHALSTHAVATELDFFTAVDDLQPGEDSGAGMMGIVEFNAAVFYRYALVDVAQLRANLVGDRVSAADATVGFARAAVAAIPSGKQNSMAAQNVPSYVRVQAFDKSAGAPWSLANAFLDPVRPTRAESDLARASVARLEAYHDDLARMYGARATRLDRRSSVFEGHQDQPLGDSWAELTEVLR